MLTPCCAKKYVFVKCWRTMVDWYHNNVGGILMEKYGPHIRLTLLTYPYPTLPTYSFHLPISDLLLHYQPWYNQTSTKFIICFLSHTIGTWEKVSHRVISIQYSNHPAYCCFSDVLPVFWFTKKSGLGLLPDLRHTKLGSSHSMDSA